MVSVDLPFLDPRRDRHGVVRYWSFRRNGQRWPLPGKPGSEEWTTEYNRLLVETAPKPPADPPADRRDYTRGTFGALINDYLASGEFNVGKGKKKKKSARTKASYERLCQILQREHGSKRVAHMERRHVRQIRDAKADTPGEANNVLRMVKILLNFAVDDGLIKASPAAKFQELPLGEWRAWTDDECAKFEKRWAPGTMQRRAFAARALHRAEEAGPDQPHESAPQGRRHLRGAVQDGQRALDTGAPGTDRRARPRRRWQPTRCCSHRRRASGSMRRTMGLGSPMRSTRPGCPTTACCTASVRRPPANSPTWV